jgi:tetratricopeptide (TPR) repeat protein
VYYLDWSGAEAHVKRAIELNPRFEEVHYFYSFYLLVLARWDQAIAEGKLAAAYDPFSVRISQHLGSVLYHARRYDEAVRQYRLILESDPENVAVHESLGDVFEQQGRNQDAIAQWKLAAIAASDSELAAIFDAADCNLSLATTLRAVAMRRIERLTNRTRKGERVLAIHFTRAYLRLDDKERALHWLTSACEEHNVHALTIGSDPIYDPLRTDQRFIKLLQGMRLAG